MYRNLFIALAFCMAASQISAQHFYIKAGAGYHIPLTFQEAPEFFGAAIIVSTGTGSYYTSIITGKKEFSLAKGLSYTGNAGYMFNDHVGFELGLHYFQVKQNINSDDVAPHYPIGSTLWQFRTFNVVPALILTQQFKRFSFSAKAGFIAGLSSLGKSIIFEEKRKTFKFNTSLASGYLFGFEINYSVYDHVSVSAESGIENLFYKPRKALLKYDDFTYWKLDDLPVYLTEIIYVRKVDHEPVYYDSANDTYYTDYYKPLMRLKEPLKLNSFFFGIGLKYNFGTHEKN